MRNKILVFGLLTCFFLSGCGKEDSLKSAQKSVLQSEFYYEQAVNSYKALLSKTPDAAAIYFELAKVYFGHGDFKQAIEQLKRTKDIPQAHKLLAISYYRLGDFTDALEVFNKDDAPDDESRYYYGLTCEKLNLYDQALGAYRKINAPQFIDLAKERIDAIEKNTKPALIKDLDPAAAAVITNAPSIEKYPQAGALILSCDEQIEITPSNTQISTMHYIIKILNERGKQDFSETQIEYDSTYEKVQLEYARTIRPDLAVMDVGSRHIRDVSKYMNFPLYSNARVYIISFPEITEGAVIEYKFKIFRNQLINKKDFVLNYSVQSQEPVISANFTLSLPAEKKLHIKTMNEKYNNFGAQLKPLKEKKAGSLVYKWEFRDIPQIIPEANMPPASQVNPAILISTFNSWQDIYDWWWKLAQDKMEADAAIKEKVKELTQNLNTDEERIKAIYNFCAQKIRYVAVEYGQAGYEPHKAEDIFKNKYGDCKDQSILLITMLKEAGISAYPVLIATKEYYNLNDDFPAVLFNHCIAAVSAENGAKLIFLDPTAETCPFGDLPAGDQKRRVFVLTEQGFKIEDTPLYEAAHNLVKQDITVTLHADESISALKSISTFGVYDQGQRYWLLYTPPQLIEESLKEKVQEISIGAELGRYEIKNLNDLNFPVLLEYQFTGSEYFTSAGPLRILPQLAGLDTVLVAKNTRNYPIDFSILNIRDSSFNISIPEGFTVKYMPPSVSEDNRWLNFLAEYKQDGGNVLFRQKLELKVEEIPENEYQDFKKFYEDAAKRIKQRIILEKIEKRISEK